MEIISSGGLPVGLSEKEFFESRSLPRNKELMRVFSDVDLCEQLGSGTRKIFRNYPKEVVRISEHFVSVVLPYSKEAMSIMADQKGARFVTSVTPQVAPQDRIVEFCSIPRSKDEITQFLGLKDKKSVSERYIKPLIVENRLAMTLPNTPTSRNQRYVAVKGMSIN